MMSISKILGHIFKDRRNEYYNQKHQHQNEQYKSVAQKYGGHIPNTAWVIDRNPTIRDANEWGEVLTFNPRMGFAIVKPYNEVHTWPWHPLS